MNFTPSQIAAASDVPLNIVERGLPIISEALENHHFYGPMIEIATLSTLTAHYRWEEVSQDSINLLCQVFEKHRIALKARRKNWCGIQLELNENRWDNWLPFIHTVLNLLKQA